MCWLNGVLRLTVLPPVMLLWAQLSSQVVAVRGGAVFPDVCLAGSIVVVFSATHYPVTRCGNNVALPVQLTSTHFLFGNAIGDITEEFGDTADVLSLADGNNWFVDVHHHLHHVHYHHAITKLSARCCCSLCPVLPCCTRPLLSSFVSHEHNSFQYVQRTTLRLPHVPLGTACVITASCGMLYCSFAAAEVALFETHMGFSPSWPPVLSVPHAVIAGSDVANQSAYVLMPTAVATFSYNHTVPSYGGAPIVAGGWYVASIGLHCGSVRLFVGFGGGTAT